jgi:glycosyltransferase involved in cell wall biosynthesis
METMVAGVPLISTNCKGLREVVEKTPSRNVPPADSEAFSKALMDEMINSTKKNSIEYVGCAQKRFDVQKEFEGLKNLYGLIDFKNKSNSN